MVNKSFVYDTFKIKYLVSLGIILYLKKEW